MHPNQKSHEQIYHAVCVCFMKMELILLDEHRRISRISKCSLQTLFFCFLFLFFFCFLMAVLLRFYIEIYMRHDKIKHLSICLCYLLFVCSSDNLIFFLNKIQTIATTQNFSRYISLFFFNVWVWVCVWMRVFRMWMYVCVYVFVKLIQSKTCNTKEVNGLCEVFVCVWWYIKFRCEKKKLKSWIILNRKKWCVNGICWCECVCVMCL